MSSTSPPTSVPTTAPPSASNGGSSFEQFLGQQSGGTGASTAQVVPPGAAESAYQYETYVANLPVQVGQTMAQMLGVKPGQYTGAQLQQAMSDLSFAQVAQFQSFLHQAGMYFSSTGAPLTGTISGTIGNQDFIALANLVSYANNTGSSIDNVAAQRIGSGAGQQAEQPVNEPVVGGGNVYNIKLDDPASVREVATSIFQSALGRNPTEAEFAKVAGAVRSGELAQQLTERNASEQMSQQQYRATIDKRNAPYQSRPALGAVPTGPFKGPGDAAIALLQYMGGNGQTIPVTQSNVQFIMALSSQFSLNTPQGMQQAVQKLSSFGNVQAALSSGDATGQLAGNTGLQADLKKMGAGDVLGKANSYANQAQSAIQSNPVLATMQAAATNPQVAAYLRSQQQNAQGGFQAPFVGGVGAALGQAPSPTTPGTPYPSTPAADVGGAGGTVPGDQYINPTTTETTNPLSPEQASFNAATTGANRIEYAGNNYLNGFLTIAQAIRNGGYQ